MSVHTCDRCGGMHYGSLCRDDANYQDDPAILHELITELQTKLVLQKKVKLDYRAELNEMVHERDELILDMFATSDDDPRWARLRERAKALGII